MAQFELVGFPMILSFIFLLLAVWVFFWRKMKLKKAGKKLSGSIDVVVLAISILILAFVSLFIGLFFLITG
jgi:hypothetical protein